MTLVPRCALVLVFVGRAAFGQAPTVSSLKDHARPVPTRSMALLVDYDSANPTLEAMSREQLLTEQQRITDARPSLEPPIGLMVGGGGGIVLGVAGGILDIAIAFALSSGGGGSGSVILGFFILAVVVAVGGLATLIAGIVKMVLVVRARNRTEEHRKIIQERLDDDEQAPSPPPPPAPFPGVMVSPQPTVRLAVF